MARRRFVCEDSWRKKGYGEGQGRDYKPWLPVRTVGSQGMANRVLGRTTGRKHDFHSNLEYRCFLLLDWSDSVVDIREQFPLHELSETQEIAAELGYKHPAYLITRKRRRCRVEMTMTTDFLISTNEPGTSRLAISVKPSAKLSGRRTLEKLEIEKRYWHRRAVPWILVTEREIAHRVVENLRLIHTYRSLVGYPVDPGLTELLLDELHLRLSRAHQSLGAVCSSVERDLLLEHGVAIAVVYHAVAAKRWEVDLEAEIAPDRPFPLLSKSVT